MSPIVPPVRSESRPGRVLGAFFASLVVHALVAFAFVFAWPARSPQKADGASPLLVELVPQTAPLLHRPVDMPAVAPVASAPDKAAPDPSVQGDRAAPPSMATMSSRHVGAPAEIVTTTAPASPAAPNAFAPGEPAVGSPVAFVASGPIMPARPSAPAPPVVDDGMPAIGGGDPDDVVRAWLAMHQHYPRAARRHRIEGTVTLAFALDARGRVVRAAIDGTSGSRVLDRAALDLLGRAEPFPVAASDASTELPFEIEVEYRLASAGLR